MVTCVNDEGNKQLEMKDSAHTEMNKGVNN